MKAPMRKATWEELLGYEPLPSHSCGSPPVLWWGGTCLVCTWITAATCCRPYTSQLSAACTSSAMVGLNPCQTANHLMYQLSAEQDRHTTLLASRPCLRCCTILYHQCVPTGSGTRPLASRLVVKGRNGTHTACRQMSATHGGLHDTLPSACRADDVL